MSPRKKSTVRIIPITLSSDSSKEFVLIKRPVKKKHAWPNARTIPSVLCEGSL